MLHWEAALTCGTDARNRHAHAAAIGGGRATSGLIHSDDSQIARSSSSSRPGKMNSNHYQRCRSRDGCVRPLAVAWARWCDQKPQCNAQSPAYINMLGGLAHAKEFLPCVTTAYT